MKTSGLRKNKKRCEWRDHKFEKCTVDRGMGEREGGEFEFKNRKQVQRSYAPESTLLARFKKARVTELGRSDSTSMGSWFTP